MNGSFLSHLVKAIGYAVVNGGEEADSRDQSGTRARSARRTSYAGANASTKGKKCCTAKREAGGGAPAASAPIATAPGTSFGTMSPVRRSGGRGSASR